MALKPREAARKLKEETKKQISTAITAAFAFLLAFVWRDVISEYVNKIIEKLAIEGPAPFIKLYAAVLTSIICILGLIIINKWAHKPEPK